MPQTAQEWALWSWAHRDSHNRIRQAIKLDSGIDLVDYQIDPISPDDFSHFLQNNAQLHDDMNSVLQLNGVNLEDANLKEPAQLRSWINIHFKEHYDAEFKLGTG
jgi:hypothetical protein